MNHNFIALVITILTAVLLYYHISRVRARRLLHASEARCRFLYEHTSDLIIRLKKDGTITFLSAFCKPMLGYAPDEIMGMNILEFFHKDDVEVMRNLLLAGVVENSTMTFRILHKDGNYIWIEGCHKTVSSIDEKGAEEIISDWRDISERKAREDEIRSYKLNLENIVCERTSRLKLVNEALSRELTEKKENESSLYMQNTILKACNDLSEQLLKNINVDSAFEEGLEIIGLGMELERIIIYETMINSEGTVTANLQNEWTSEKLPSRSGKMEELDLHESGLERWSDFLGQGRIIFGSIDDVPDAEKAFLARNEIKSFLIVPVISAGKLRSFVFLQHPDPKKEWSIPEITSLKPIAETIKAGMDRKAFEDELNMLVMAVEHSPVSIMITDTDGNIEYINPKFTRVTGYTLKEVIGENVRILKSGHHGHEHYASMWKILLSGREWTGEFLNRKKNGELTWEYEYISPIMSKGHITHFIGIKEDITERKEYEKRLNEAKEIAESANKAKSEFLANMSHEMRTPLNSILGMVELLKSSRLPPEQIEYATAISNSSKMLLSLINETLDMSKIEAGKVELKKEPFDLLEVLEEAAQQIMVSAAEKEIRLYVRFLPDTPRYLSGDAIRLRQILFNLAGNAVKFTDTGYVLIMASALTSNKKTAQIKFDVIDTGIGIPENSRKSIFDKFTQIDSSRTRRYGGTGLGLPISKRLVELMGGNLTVSDSTEQGSTFTFTLEMPVVEIECIDDTASEINLANTRILVADESSIARKIICEHLSHWGIPCTESASGHETLGKLENSTSSEAPFAVCIIDEQFQDLSTPNLIGEIRKNKKLANVKIIVVSVRGELEKGIKKEEAFLVKRPIKLSWLKSMISELVSGRLVS